MTKTTIYGYIAGKEPVILLFMSLVICYVVIIYFTPCVLNFKFHCIKFWSFYSYFHCNSGLNIYQNALNKLFIGKYCKSSTFCEIQSKPLVVTSGS